MRPPPAEGTNLWHRSPSRQLESSVTRILQMNPQFPGENGRRCLGIVVLFMALLSSSCSHAETALHARVLVFVPAYEGSQLWDPDLNAEPTCVWGSLNVLLSAKLYFGMRLPNPLEARTMAAVGPIDVYGKFMATMTRKNDATPHFSPYTEGSDFFVFNYDWRQDIGAVSAPLLGRALERYAQIHEEKTGIPARDTQFIIVTHSMGGLVARTLLSEEPAWAPRIAGMYLVGSPNAGSVKAINTVVYGPDSIKSAATGFPGVLLNLIPTNVDQNVTKLTGITRPSLYELLPTGDPHWTCVQENGEGRRMNEDAVWKAESWEPYWPSPALEKGLFLDGWLKNREAEGRKKIDPPDWEFCQDPGYGALKKILAQVNAWRARMGSLRHTAELMTRPGEPTRLRLILSTGLKTPSGVTTSGEHDTSRGVYTYDDGDGDGTVEARRVLEGLSASAPNVKVLHGIPHGKLMSNSQFLPYFLQELSGQPLVPGR
jgi:hypothetical protein